jgi:Icc-related predicted phosphoesterase
VRIVVFSDIHGDLAALEQVLAIEADHYFAAGDLVSWALGLDRVGKVLRRRAGRTYVLPGNHESAADIAEMCRAYGLEDFHGRSIQLGGYRIAGLGYSNPTPFGTPGEYSEKELAERLEPFAALERLILICHCPPKGTPLDQAGPGRHLGSQAVRDFIDQYQPELFFCGHIHEAHGLTAHIGRTRAFNVGKRGRLVEL